MGDAALAEWVTRARGGDRAAFGHLWQAFSPQVHGYLRGRGVASPEDVTSEVFVAAFRGISAFAGDAVGFRSWLFTIAHHKAVDDLRRRVPTVEWTPDADPRRTTSAEDDAFVVMADERIERMLRALTPEQREVLLLRIGADLSVAEVASITGRTDDAVRQLHRRALGAARRATEQSDTADRSIDVVPLPDRWSDSRRSPVTRAASTPMTELP